jgi:hypothetical protein
MFFSGLSSASCVTYQYISEVMTEAEEDGLYSSGTVADSKHTNQSIDLGPIFQRKQKSDLKNLTWSNIQVTLVRFP